MDQPIRCASVRGAMLGALLVLCSSCGPSTDSDGGLDGRVSLDAGRDGAVVLCAADRECDNSLFCDGVERCMPGLPGADARGCVSGTVPCAMCDEASDQCECGVVADMDGDGHDSIACGGGDCDDEDDQRFPGNGEVCDTEGHDEDCDDATVGSTDVDTDGFVDAVCCNTVYGVCGDDCDDGDINVNPGASESCNGTDDDCDDITDESAPGDLLCPGGLCLSGSCQLDAWELPFGDTRHDWIMDVSIDTLGNVVAAGGFSGSIDFGSGPAPHGGVVLVGFAPDGRHRWDHDVDACAGLDISSRPTRSAGVATDAAQNVYLAVCCTAFTGAAQTMLSSYEADGTLRWSYPTFGGCADAIEMTQDGASVLVGGTLSGTTDLGGGSWTSTMDDGFVVQLSTMGAYESEYKIDGIGDERLLDVAAGADGAVVVGLEVGWWSGAACFDVGPDSSCETPVVSGRRHGSVAVISSAGTLMWDRTIGLEVTAVSVAPDGGVVAGGVFTGVLSVGGPDVTGVGPSYRPDGVVVAYDRAGVYEWKRHLESSGVVRVNDIDIGPDGVVAVTGAFSDTVLLFGSPAGEGRDDRDLFVVWYGRDGSRVRQLTIGAAGNDDSLGVAIGDFRDVAFGGTFWGTVSLGSGTYTSRGFGDGFVIRMTY